MEFAGFTNNDFDFFRKKGSMSKAELDDRKEEVKRRFREFCYQLQKSYHSVTGGTLLLDKDFQGLGKNRNYIYASSKINCNELFNLYIFFTQEGININISCPPDGDYMKFQQLKGVINTNKEIIAKFFKENKPMFLTLYSRNLKKQGEDTWTEEYKFNNNEMCYGNYDTLLKNMEKLQPSVIDGKSYAGMRIAAQYLKVEASKIGKALPGRVCADVVKLQELCCALKL